MKKIFFLVVVLAAISNANGQARADLYWVVESERDLRESQVKIYDSNHQLVHQIRTARRFDISRRRDRKALNQILNRYVDGLSTHRKKNKSKSSV